jgi:hypothetical protein
MGGDGMSREFLRQKANDHAQVAAESLMVWNEELLTKEDDQLFPAMVGLFVIFADIMLAIHYDLQTMMERGE